MMKTMAVAVPVLLFSGVLACADYVDQLVHPGAARAVLLAPEVRKYLHTDLPSRQPLLVSDRLLLAQESDLALPFQVVIVRGEDPRQGKAFEFTSTRAGEGGTIVVTFKFRPEGMDGRAVLRNTKQGWVVVSCDTSES
jgi:hypothetical protein